MVSFLGNVQRVVSAEIAQELMELTFGKHSGDKATLKRLIGNLNKKELIKVMGILVNASDKAEQKLLDYCQKNATEENKNLIVEKQMEDWMKFISICSNIIKEKMTRHLQMTYIELL